jgi:hypothetical protein
MPSSAYYERQAHTLARYASVCEDDQQADRLRGMARRMLQKAREAGEPAQQARQDAARAPSPYGCLWIGSTQ